METLVPKQKLPKKAKTLIYLGIGTDVWVPFGILNATNVIAYDKIDPFYMLAPGQTLTQQLYVYAVTLAAEITALEATKIKWTLNLKEKKLHIRFQWNVTEPNVGVSCCILTCPQNRVLKTFIDIGYRSVESRIFYRLVI